MTVVTDIKAVVTDIEGTTSSLSFVKDVLFPYAREHIGNYVRDHADDDNVKPLLDDVCSHVGEALDVEQIVNQLEQWIDNDKKITPLKSLQGLLWEKGYQHGDFKGHIYADAHQQLVQWHQQGLQLFVYSSGSVYAQKLLFGHTEYGDLNNLFSDYFDTHIGAKIESDSYQKIAEQTGFSADNILFLSDIKAELDAAADAGMRVIWLVRDGQIDPAADYRQVQSFSEITL